ncbi:MAG: putative Ig domain-containing protein [Deltaproteobacteria bacterium]|nr:putative Ig domain-containing protein [Deltaproteobacteria bacterium]
MKRTRRRLLYATICALLAAVTVSALESLDLPSRIGIFDGARSATPSNEPQRSPREGLSLTASAPETTGSSLPTKPSSAVARAIKEQPVIQAAIRSTLGDMATDWIVSAAQERESRDTGLSEARARLARQEQEAQRSLSESEAFDTRASGGARADTSGRMGGVRPLTSFVDDVVQTADTISNGAARRSSLPVQDLPEAKLNIDYCATLQSEAVQEIASAKLTRGVSPKGLTLDRKKGTLCGIPTETGIFRFEAELSDTNGVVAKVAFRLVVSEGADADEEGPLRIATDALPPAEVGAEYAEQLSAQGGLPPYRWEVEGVPDGMEADAASGLLGGNPSVDGEFSVTVTVLDADGGVDSRALLLTVRRTPVYVTTSALEAGVLGEAYQARLEAQGGEPPYAWSVTGGKLPSGLELNPANGVIEGTPAEAHEGVIRFTVTDALENTDSADLPLEVNPSPLAITSRGTRDAFQNESYQFELAATRGTPPYTWTISQGKLPKGLLLSPSGEISGVPTVRGDSGFAVTVTDQNGQVATRRFQIRVAEAPVSEPTPLPSVQPTPEVTSGVSNENDTAPEVPPIVGLKAIASENKAGIVWQNPSEPTFVEAIIVRRADRFPAVVDDGDVVYRGTATDTLDLEVLNGQVYYYAAFASHADGLFSSPGADSQALVEMLPIQFNGESDPFVDAVANFQPLDKNCFGCNRVPAALLGPPSGGGESTGSTDVVSIGARVNSDSSGSAPYGGTVTLEFTNNIIVDGPGADFTVFENAFRPLGTDTYFVEPATVEVSVDGVRFYRFPFDFVPHYDSKGQLNLTNPFSYPFGLAGVRPVYSTQNIPAATNPALSGGDPFDLADLPGRPVRWARFVRLTSTGDNWLTDLQGEAVRHSNSTPTWSASGVGNSGFDLDAVAAVNY